MIKLPKDFIAAGYTFDAVIPSPKFETARIPDGSVVFRAGYETNEVEEFAQNVARKMTEKVDAAILDELLRLNGYVPAAELYRFPENKRAARASFGDQLNKLSEELTEVCDAFIDGEPDSRVIEELWDVIQAAEGMLRKFAYSAVLKGLVFVRKKSRERGDYQ